MKLVLSYVAFAMITHVASFALQSFYQRYCYPISLVGFFTTTVTSTSTLCVAAAQASGMLNNTFNNVMIHVLSLLCVCFVRTRHQNQE